MVLEQSSKPFFVVAVPRARVPDVPERVPSGMRPSAVLEVVFEQKLLSCAHRGLRLVHVGRLREREQLRDPIEDSLLFSALLIAWDPASRSIDPEPLAYLTERRTVGGLLDLQRLVDVLMRHLVFEHLDDHTPTMLQHEGA